jgi:hypothetical protein
MTDESRHLIRKLFAALLVLFGMTILALDVHTSFKRQGPLHYLNIGVAVGLGFVGGWLLNRLEAESVADAILKRLPLISTLWPGGKRATDPPPQPGVPAPPSVTNVQPPHVTELDLPPAPAPRPILADHDRGAL